MSEALHTNQFEVGDINDIAFDFDIFGTIDVLHGGND
jgi:hypothetical protein